ncbi:hypothetical protein S7711_05158 [Stachybotrys chartarum IBT 7711]|uniref:HAUS augmin-like complex subunit 3 N-terminal domain-containing protein n=1 Tax=Stachybotrys chartarum (strain CBS 109288 / IBT 7711) TaxID=1280523 RepID=A0A084B4K4_STACB|nr:hypothetical protein S7711_05158 [Stachybotrys chartarum IBT 7711]KFA48312.1 hypothetical protein S40293_04449 [Stachybotrys chartarum IBT 40293]
METETTTKKNAEALLLKAARAHGIQLRRDQAQQVAADTAFAEWAVQHLTPDTLVTADELALYTALDKSGEVDRLATLHDLAEVAEVREDDVRTAIEELRRSTENINKQTETLRQQRAALDRLVNKDAESEARREQLEASQSRKFEADRKRIAAEVEELSQSLGFRVADLEQQVKDAEPSLNHTVDGIFQSDDSLLSSLQKLGWELDQQDPEQTQLVETLRETCMRLIMTTVETVRARLDTVYLESLLSDQSPDDVSEDEVKALEAEVESLYSEILPVAQMSVEQQYLEPALKSIDAKSGQSMRRSATATTYINDCLDYLLGRAERLQSGIETYQSHRMATASFANIAKAELAVDPSPPRKQSKPPMPASPVRRPSPIRMRSNTARRRSSGIQEDAALDTLLQTLAISLPADEDDNDAVKVAALAKLVDERSGKSRDVARNAQETFEATANAQLDDARRAVQLLQDSVLAESPFSRVMLMDPEIEASIAFLAHEVDKAKTQLAEMGGPMVKSAKKAAFLQRWG